MHIECVIKDSLWICNANIKTKIDLMVSSKYSHLLIILYNYLTPVISIEASSIKLREFLETVITSTEEKYLKFKKSVDDPSVEVKDRQGNDT